MQVYSSVIFYNVVMLTLHFVFSSPLELDSHPLSTPLLKDSIAYDLALTYANCGLCTKQLNDKLATDNEKEVGLIIHNLKKSRNHLEKSLQYTQYIDHSSGSSNRQHEEYVLSQLGVIRQEIQTFEETKAAIVAASAARKDEVKRGATKKKMMRRKKKITQPQNEL